MSAFGRWSYRKVDNFEPPPIPGDTGSPSNAFVHVLNEQFQFGHSDLGGPASGLPTGTYYALLDSSGRTVQHTTPGYPKSTSAPRLPAGLPGSTGSTDNQTVFTAGDVAPGPSFRVIALGR